MGTLRSGGTGTRLPARRRPPSRIASGTGAFDRLSSLVSLWCQGVDSAPSDSWSTPQAAGSVASAGRLGSRSLLPALKS